MGVACDGGVGSGVVIDGVGGCGEGTTGVGGQLSSSLTFESLCCSSVFLWAYTQRRRTRLVNSCSKTKQKKQKNQEAQISPSWSITSSS